MNCIMVWHSSRLYHHTMMARSFVDIHRKMMLLFLAAWMPAFTAGSDTRTAPLYKLSITGSGKCLDGSPGAYYHRPAFNATYSDRWVFSLEGGGECVTQSDCEYRATTDLGSSNAYPADGSGWMSQLEDKNPDHNPEFWAWNHVFVKYCTGDLFSGMVKVPGADQWGLFFSGGLVVDGVLADLQARADLSGTARSLANASMVLWSGDSAGGIGSALSVDHVAATLPAAKVVAVPIAGFYWNNAEAYTGPGAGTYIPFGTADFEGYVSLWQSRVPARCAAALPEQPWACMLLNFSLPMAASDVFVVEYLTDSVQLSLHSGVPEYNADTAAYVEAWGRTMTAALVGTAGGKVPAPGITGRTGYFAAACYSHTAFYWSKPFLVDPANAGQGRTVSFIAAVADWLYERVEAPSSFLMDDCCSSGKVVFNPTCP